MRKNEAHLFAHRNAIHIYNPNAIYSLIPKNGCSTMRLSIAIENGCIQQPKQINWIDLNNGTFEPSLKDLMVADYTFVILRCPFVRLASCFLDKFMFQSKPFETWYGASRCQVPVDRVTFRMFCKSLSDPGVTRADPHWRSQFDFLVYEDYDDYFSVETLASDRERLEKKTGMFLYDARPLTRHGIFGKRLVDPSGVAADIPLAEHRALHARGEAVMPLRLYDDELVMLIARIFAPDLIAFDEKFPGHCLINL